MMSTEDASDLPNAIKSQGDSTWFPGVDQLIKGECWPLAPGSAPIDWTRSIVHFRPGDCDVLAITLHRQLLKKIKPGTASGIAR